MKRRFWIGLILTIAFLAILPYLIPLKNISSGKSREELMCPFGHWISIEDRNLYYEDYVPEKIENPEVIVLVHGFGGNTFSWRENIPAFVGFGYRVIAVDLLGYGLSDKDWNSDYSHEAHADRLKLFLDQLNIESAHFVGHSMGASVITHFVYKYEDYVKTLTFSGGAVFVEGENSHPSIPSFILKIPPVKRYIRHFFRFYLAGNRSNELLDSAYYDKSIVTENVLQEYSERMGIGDWDLSLLASTRDSRENNISFDLEKIIIPVLLINGTQDTWVKPEVAQNLNEKFPNSQLFLIENAGHMVMEEKSSMFNEIVLDFIEQPI